jgi:hypothetical protein
MASSYEDLSEIEWNDEIHEQATRILAAGRAQRNKETPGPAERPLRWTPRAGKNIARGSIIALNRQNNPRSAGLPESKYVEMGRDRRRKRKAEVIARAKRERPFKKV